MDKKIRLMNNDEINRFKSLSKEQLKSETTNQLGILLRINQKMKQQHDLRIEVIEELINERGIDYKSKQYPD